MTYFLVNVTFYKVNIVLLRRKTKYSYKREPSLNNSNVIII